MTAATHPAIQMAEKTDYIQDIRAFNRYYTRLLGLLDDNLLDSGYALAEARILYEIHSAGQISASQIIGALHIDKGYLSRILKKFEKDGLVSKQKSGDDARVMLIALTNKGQQVFIRLNQASEQQIGNLIQNLSPGQQQELTAHMTAIIAILGT